MEDTLRKFMSESTKRHEENSNLIKEIRASTVAAIRNQGASIKTLEIQIRQMGKVLQERRFRSYPSLTETNLRDQVKSISTTIKTDSNSIRRIGSNQYTVSTGQNSTLLYTSRQMIVPFLCRLDNHYCEEEGNYGPKFMEAYKASHINNAIPQKEKEPGNLFSEDYIELNDLNEPFELRRNQGDDLMPTIEDGEVIEEFRPRDENLDTGIDDYPSYCDDDKKIHIDFLEDMDAYRDNEMGDIIFGEPFLREVRIKTKRDLVKEISKNIEEITNLENLGRLES
ncbi:hypothetical protein Tco_1030199 [Tanacetum coccineum]|uniref:Uncharacterized protein n=1 Tax=Tanacetum coccineum TaxID=301880 RepID=A0ABQ5G740_9ASTR